jgi:UDP-N-acetylmuramoyl-L-alanyl-D-glutamate--2,6-diaminopimelate ligase
MTLAELLQNMQTSPAAHAALGQVVTQLSFDSRNLRPGSVYFAIRGGKSDGHLYLPQAAANGAICLIVEDTSLVPHDFSGVVMNVKNSRVALNQLASRAEGEPSKELFCLGVTGTNGKTTTTYLAEKILNTSGRGTGVIGTINHHYGTRIWETEMTTPDPVAFQKRLREFRNLGATAVALEASSHALTQARVDEVAFDVAIFTNLSRDHLDYHRDMDDYYRAKQKLFVELLVKSPKKNKHAIINGDDAYGAKLISDLRAAKGASSLVIWAYGENLTAQKNAAPQLAFTVLDQGFHGSRFRLDTPLGACEFHIRMPGLHNVYNAVAAIGAGMAAGVSLPMAAVALENLGGVRGRLESVENERGLFVFVDYAHTDDALRTVLQYLAEIRRKNGLQNRIITVFGCGGDRDRGKRPLMMQAAQENSDLVVLTSDNPRNEDPLSIMDDAFSDASIEAKGTAVPAAVFKEVDRRRAIEVAIGLAQPGDVVLIAGKGHENYQQIGQRKYPFDDVSVAKEFLQ